MGEPTILATSGGYLPHPRLSYAFGPILTYAVELSGAHGRRPRVTTVGTAMGDQRHRLSLIHISEPTRPY